MLNAESYEEFKKFVDWKKEQIEFRGGDNYVENGHKLIDKTIKK